MCGIILSEEDLDHSFRKLVTRRGKGLNTKVKYNETLFLLSAVNSIRSDVNQPIFKDGFTLQYNGEIYNGCESDTLFVQEIISNVLKSCKGKGVELFDFVSKIYLEINKSENELAICFTYQNFVFFFKDDVGRRSLGYSEKPFTLSSCKYEKEIDPMKLYIYSLEAKKVVAIFKPQSILVNRYLNNIKLFERYIVDDKLIASCSYLFGYGDIIKSSKPDIPKLPARENSVDLLHSLLLKSFTKRKFDKDPVVFLSGGIDSLIVAIYIHLTVEPDKTIFLINTAVPGSFDREMGILAYTDLKNMFPERNFNFIENDLTLGLVLEHKNRISELIYPKTSKMDFNIGTILYFSSIEASKHSKVVFLGSGADEVFGGYSKYKFGDFRDNMLFDLFTISAHNLCRDDRVIGDSCVEARFPLLDTEIINFSLDCQESDFINKGSNKFILREILRLNKFERASEVPKKAMQYGTGMNKFEEELFKK